MAYDRQKCHSQNFAWNRTKSNGINNGHEFTEKCSFYCTKTDNFEHVNFKSNRPKCAAKADGTTPECVATTTRGWPAANDTEQLSENGQVKNSANLPWFPKFCKNVRRNRPSLVGAHKLFPAAIVCAGKLSGYWPFCGFMRNVLYSQIIFLYFAFKLQENFVNGRREAAKFILLCKWNIHC